MKQPYEIGMVGLGVMGRNLVLNMVDHGVSVAGYDKDSSKVQALRQATTEKDVCAADSVEELVDALRVPRAIMLLVPAGKVVDAVIDELVPHLDAGDLIIDGGNSYFEDTTRRAAQLAKKEILFLGVGISGGAAGARHGPSMMPGGPKEAYERVRSIFEAVAAQVNSDPCVAYLGPRSAGHYVKMVHNGIEYGLMQLIAESYDLMKSGLGLSNDELSAVYREWNDAELNGYLMSITADIFRYKEKNSGAYLLDDILDRADQTGTGMWTSQDAMRLQVPVPTIDMAVTMRNLSVFSDQREEISKLLPSHGTVLDADRQSFLAQVRRALYAAMILTYTQGMAQLWSASQAYAYDLDLEAVARIWRGGCIIRAALLEDFRDAYKRRADLPNLLLDASLRKLVSERQQDLRAVVAAAARLGRPAPAFSAALAYFDGYRSAWLPANLIQAQRDYFGSHRYQRVDRPGTFHTEWEQAE
jgi:6-phosphogluconate dehydrogenase